MSGEEEPRPGLDKGVRRIGPFIFGHRESSVAGSIKVADSSVVYVVEVLPLR